MCIIGCSSLLTSFHEEPVRWNVDDIQKSAWESTTDCDLGGNPVVRFGFDVDDNTGGGLIIGNATAEGDGPALLRGNGIISL